MRALRAFGILVLTVVLASVWGCGATRTHEGTGQYVDDSVITTKMKTAIFSDATLKVNEINVETFKGVVQLSERRPADGFLPDETACAGSR
jgi:hypothetical protein